MNKQNRDQPAETDEKEPVSQGGPLGVSQDEDTKKPAKDGALSTTRSAPPQGPSS